MSIKIIKLTDERLSEMYDKTDHLRLSKYNFFLKEKERLNLQLDNFFNPFCSEDREFLEFFFTIKSVTNFNNIPSVELTLEKCLLKNKESYINFFKDLYTIYEDYLFYPFKSFFLHTLEPSIDLNGNIVPNKYKIKSDLNHGLLKIGSKEQFKLMFKKEIEWLD